MRAIVTGGTGFIGKWLVKELLVSGYEVTAFVRRMEAWMKDQPVRYIQYHSKEYLDLLQEDAAQYAYDVFFHLAWGGVAPEEKNNSELQLENIRLSLDMLEYAAKLQVKKFIATGTVAEYAFCETVMDVNARQTPNDMYGAAKTAAHYLLETRARMLAMPFVWAVIPSTFGEGRRDNNILTYTIRTLLKGERPSYGYLTQMWDFLYVEEVVRALRLLGEKGIPDKTYGIGSGVYKPLKEYIIAIRNLINPMLPLGIGEKPELSNKAFSSCVNIDELTKDTGFIPQVSFEDGIRRVIQVMANEAAK